MVVTGSWDKTIKYWDMRSPTAAASILCQDRVYAMDAKDKLLVVGLAEKHIHIIDLHAPGKIFKNFLSPLKHQTRAIR